MRFKRIWAKTVAILKEPIFRYPLNEPINVVFNNRFLKVLFSPLALTVWGTCLIPYFLKQNTSVHINERIVEIPLLFNMLSVKPGMRVLDFGCNESKVSIQLASLGCNVVGVDLEEYLLQHPNFSFAHGDFLDVDFPAGLFDIITAVSALEHTGLSYYSGEVHDRADYLIVDKFLEILKDGGQFFLSVPFGVEQTFSPYYRVYGESIYDLLRSFSIEQEHFFSKTDQGYWASIDRETVLDLANSEREVKNVGIFLCKKKRHNYA